MSFLVQSRCCCLSLRDHSRPDPKTPLCVGLTLSCLYAFKLSELRSTLRTGPQLQHVSLVSSLPHIPPGLAENSVFANFHFTSSASSMLLRKLKLSVGSPFQFHTNLQANLCLQPPFLSVFYFYRCGISFSFWSHSSHLAWILILAPITNHWSLL